MRNPEAPVIAAWLLRKFVKGDRSESLLGDLLEEYQAGRAPGWYWRETLVALLYAMRRGGRRLFSRRVAYFILALIAQFLLSVWILGQSEQHLRGCPALPALLRATTVPMLLAGAAEVAIVLAIWFGPFASAVRAGRKSGLLGLLVLTFVAGLGGGALTWAGTASCAAGPQGRSPTARPAHSGWRAHLQ